MSRCIQKCNFFTVNADNISTDMLCNTTRLMFRYIGFTNGIQKGSLTVVNVTHYADNRWTFFHLAFVLFFLFQKFRYHIYFFFQFRNNIERKSDFFCFIKSDFLIQRNHLTLHK